MTDARRIAKNSVFYATALITQGLTEVIVALFLARLAGAEQLGEFTTLVTLAGLFAFVSDFGLPGLLTREIARRRQDKDQAAKLVNASVGLVVVLSVVAIMLMIVLGLWLGYSSGLLRALILTGLALGFESMAMVVAAAFRGIEELQWASAVIVVMQIAFTAMALPAILAKVGIDWLMTTYLMSRVLSLLVAAWFFRRSRFGKLRPVADWKLWLQLLKTGFPFSINSVFSFTYSRVDVVILSLLAGNVAVGFYEVAYSLTMRLNIVARTITYALYPFLSSEFVRDKRAVRACTAQSIRYLIVPAFLIATIYCVFGREFILLLYGEKFATAASATLSVLALAIPLRFVETSLAVALDASNRAGQRATAVAIAAVTNVLLNFGLVPIYQMKGAAYATLFTELIICGLFLWYLRNELHDIIQWRTFVAPSLGALIIFGVPPLFEAINVWLLVSLSIALYIVTVVALDRDSIETLLLMGAKKPPVQ